MMVLTRWPCQTRHPCVQASAMQSMECRRRTCEDMANASNGSMSVEKVQAAVRIGPGKTEIREFPMPEIPADAALMKMEVAGICGTDVKLYANPPTPTPTIMGHENIG